MVVYMTKSRGQNAKNWALGTPERQMCTEERLLLHLTQKQREDR